MVAPSKQIIVSTYKDRVEIRDGALRHGLLFPFRGEIMMAPKPLPPTTQQTMMHPVEEPKSTFDAYGLLGVLEMFSSSVLILAKEVFLSGSTPNYQIHTVKKVSLVRLSTVEATDKEKAFAGVVLSVLESGGLFFSYEADATVALQSPPDEEDTLCWNKTWLG